MRAGRFGGGGPTGELCAESWESTGAERLSIEETVTPLMGACD
jgi:hypothetical protein